MTNLLFLALLLFTDATLLYDMAPGTQGDNYFDCVTIQKSVICTCETNIFLRRLVSTNGYYLTDPLNVLSPNIVHDDRYFFGVLQDTFEYRFH